MSARARRWRERGAPVFYLSLFFMAESRLIRRGLLDSERFNALGWQAQSVYFRLLLVADDFGLFDARPAFLRAQLFGMCLDRVREADLQRGLAACEEAGLVRFYAVAGKPYLMIERYGQRGKGRPKFPLPPGFALVAVKAGRSTEWEMAPQESAAVRGGPPRVAADDGGSPRPAALVEDGVGVAYGVEDADADGFADGESPGNAAGGCSSQGLPPPPGEVARTMGALSLANLQGAVLEECAARFVDDCGATGWCGRNGLPLRDWRAAARNYARRYAENLAKGSPRRPVGGQSAHRKDCNNADDYR